MLRSEGNVARNASNSSNSFCSVSCGTPPRALPTMRVATNLRCHAKSRAATDQGDFEMVFADQLFQWRECTVLSAVNTEKLDRSDRCGKAVLVIISNHASTNMCAERSGAVRGCKIRCNAGFAAWERRRSYCAIKSTAHPAHGEFFIRHSLMFETVARFLFEYMHPVVLFGCVAAHDAGDRDECRWQWRRE